jgi:hypothetical protein
MFIFATFLEPAPLKNGDKKSWDKFIYSYFPYSLSCRCAHCVPLSLLPFETSLPTGQVGSITSSIKNSAPAWLKNS